MFCRCFKDVLTDCCNGVSTKQTVVYHRTENLCTVSTPVVPYKALEKFSKILYGTTGGNYSAYVFRPVMWCFSVVVTDFQKHSLDFWNQNTE